MKLQLHKRPHFDLSQAFKLLNLEGFHKVSQEDLQHVLKVHGLITFHRQANVLFTRFDKDKDGMIDFLDFKHEI
jgi:Ca2+-binding EF-hand superfamily protein